MRENPPHVFSDYRKKPQRCLSERTGVNHILRNVSFTLGCERLGIVSESGSGKSTTGRALMGLLPPSAIIKADRLSLGEMNLLGVGERKLRSVRGRRIAMVLQDPKYSLNPTRTVGRQIRDTYRVHFGGSPKTADSETLAMLDAVRIRDPERVYNLYPHEISGGMGQRVMIAMMLIAKPEVLIADEPTSALDVSVKREVMAILDGLVRERGMGLILISHDLNLVAGFCRRRPSSCMRDGSSRPAMRMGSPIPIIPIPAVCSKPCHRSAIEGRSCHSCCVTPDGSRRTRRCDRTSRCQYPLWSR